MNLRALVPPVAVAGVVALTAAACLRPGGPAPVTPTRPPVPPLAASPAPVAAQPAAVAVPAAPVAAPPASAAPEKVDPAICYLGDRALVVPPGPAGPPRGGSIFGRDSPPAPATEGPSAFPDLDKEIIRRTIRSHINQVKACYESGLATRPTLGGTIVVEFLIPPSGAVSQTRLASSTMGAPAVDECVARAMCGWQFPRPLSGGSIAITYPYKLTPSARDP